MQQPVYILQIAEVSDNIFQNYQVTFHEEKQTEGVHSVKCKALNVVFVGRGLWRIAPSQSIDGSDVRMENVMRTDMWWMRSFFSGILISGLWNFLCPYRRVMILSFYVLKHSEHLHLSAAAFQVNTKAIEI